MSHSDLTRARVFLEVRTRSLYRPHRTGKKNLIGFSPLQGRPHRLGAEGSYGLSWMTKAGWILRWGAVVACAIAIGRLPSRAGADILTRKNEGANEADSN